MASKTEIDQDYELTFSHHDEGLRVKRRRNGKLYRGTIEKYGTGSDSDDDSDEEHYIIKFDDKTKKKYCISRNTLQRRYTICGRKKPCFPRPSHRICKEIADLEKIIKSFPRRGRRRCFLYSWQDPWNNVTTPLQVFERFKEEFGLSLYWMKKNSKRDHQRLKKFREKIQRERMNEEAITQEMLIIIKKSVIQELKHIHNPLFTFHNT